jgi:glycosyltransferase involved in cell wall biosynthesis
LVEKRPRNGNSIKIEMVSEELGRNAGGLSRYIINLATALRSLGHDVDLFTPIHCLGFSPAKRLVYNLVQCNSLRGVAEDTVVHTHTSSGSLVPIERSGVYVNSVHGVMADEAKYNSRKLSQNMLFYLLAHLEKLNCKRANWCTAPSQYSRRNAIDLYDIDSSRVDVVHPCVDLNRFKPAAPGARESSSKDVLFVGMIYRRKGLEILLRALSVLRLPEVLLRVIGTGEDKTRMERLAVKLGISNQVIFLGNVSDSDLIHYYQRSRVVCMPSLQEGFGMVAIEAQACGTPVVATNAGSLPEAVADRRWLAAPGDPYELSNVLAKALDEHNNRTHERCREFAENNFSPRTVALQMQAVYEKALSTRRS